MEAVETAPNPLVGDKIRPAAGISGTCELPGDPDFSVMALALAARAEGESEIRRCSRRPVADAMLQALSRLGLAHRWEEDALKLTGGPLQAAEGALEVGTSEVLFGCLAGLLAGAPFPSRLGCDPACAAAAEAVLEALEALGARIERPAGGGFPVVLGGQALRPGTHRIEAPSTAVKCAIFLAGLDVEGKVELEQNAAGEDDLELLLRAAKGRIEKARDPQTERYRLTLNGPVAVRPAVHDLPGDATAAAFLLFSAAAFKKSDLRVARVGTDWKSRRMLDLLRWMNASFEVRKARTASKLPTREIRIKGTELRPTKISEAYAALFLDEVPFLAVVGACTPGETIIRDVQTLRVEGADVIARVVENLRRMQAHVGEMPDGLVVKGGPRLQGAEVDAGGDSRVAMAFLLAGLFAEGETVVVNRGPVERDFPGVLDCLSSVVQPKRR